MKNIVSTGDASISKKNWNVIELKRMPTELFGFGRRHENNTPIISVDKSIMPFIYSYNIIGCYLDDAGSVYISYGIDVPLFVIKLRCNKKRSFVLSPEFMQEREIGQSVDFYGHLVTGDNEFELTRVLHRCPMRLINDISDIIPEDRVKTYQYSSLIDEHYEGEFDIEDPKNFENFIDPL